LVFKVSPFRGANAKGRAMTTSCLVRTARMLVLAVIATMLVTRALASDPPTKGASGAGAARGAGLERRVPWTTSKIAGTPDSPPPYTVEPAFPYLKFDFPVVLVRAKGTGRLFLGDLRGRIYSFPNDPGCKKADLALELGKVYPDLTASYGLTFHPDFDEKRLV
jgi:hypothetical protein